jgi:hypothetical protein
MSGYASEICPGDGEKGSRVGGVTLRPVTHNIGDVAFPTMPVLTRRRAVDFCRVATALCP